MRDMCERLNAKTIAAAVEEALPHLICELRGDVLRALERAHSLESEPRAQLVLAQLLRNAGIARDGAHPLCQDTGYVWLALEVGHTDSVGQAIYVPGDIFSMVDEAVACAFKSSGARLSLVKDAVADRSNSGDNTPAFCEVLFNPQIKGAKLHIMLKGGGSDNASKLCMLTPNAGTAGIKDFVVEAVRSKAASACPPLVIGVGVGGSFDKVAGLSKRALLRELGSLNPNASLAQLEAEILSEINDSGIGPGGFGGKTTALAVHIDTAPCHIAAMPVALNIGCVAMRSCSIDLEDSKWDHWGDKPEVVDFASKSHELQMAASSAIKVQLPASFEQLKELKAGQAVSLSGTVYTLRDVGHARVLAHLKASGELPFGLSGQTLFYAGPTPQPHGYPTRPFGAIGPTTASRMDFATPQLIGGGITAMIGKGERSEAVRKICQEHGSVYFACAGGAAAFLGSFVKSASLVAYEDLGTEACYKLDLEDFPAFVAIDAFGGKIYER